MEFWDVKKAELGDRLFPGYYISPHLLRLADPNIHVYTPIHRPHNTPSFCFVCLVRIYRLFDISIDKRYRYRE